MTTRPLGRRGGPRPGLHGALAVGIVVFVAVLFSAPGSAGPAAAATATTSASQGACGVAIAPGARTLRIRFHGTARTVIVYVPAGYSGSVKVPLVVNLQGDGGTAAVEQAFTAMDAEADLAGFLVAYPQAAIRVDGGYAWNVPGQPLPAGSESSGSGSDDLAFLTALPGMLSTRYCVNPKLVYATGYSGGGAKMTSELGCADSNIYAAVAPVGALWLPQPCPAVRAEPVVSISGNDGAVRSWATQDDCHVRHAESASLAGTEVTLVGYTHCANDAAVELYRLPNSVRGWPGGPQSLAPLVGPAVALDADAAIWSFFKVHYL